MPRCRHIVPTSPDLMAIAMLVAERDERARWTFTVHANVAEAGEPASQQSGKALQNRSLDQEQGRGRRLAYRYRNRAPHERCGRVHDGDHRPRRIDRHRHQSHGEREPDGSISTEQSLAAGVPAIDLFDPAARGSLFDLTETEDRFLILDGPAASLNMFENLTENLDAGTWVAHNSACDRDLIIIIPITPHLASIVAVGQAIDMFGTDAHYVVVRSMRGCTAADYALWDAPEFRDKFGRVVSGRSKARLAEVGGTVLDMHALNAAVLARVEALQLPFHEAIGSPLLGAAERLSVKRWLEAWTRQLEAIRGPLGLDADFAWRVL